MYYTSFWGINNPASILTCIKNDTNMLVNTSTHWNHCTTSDFEPPRFPTPPGKAMGRPRGIQPSHCLLKVAQVKLCLPKDTAHQACGTILKIHTFEHVFFLEKNIISPLALYIVSETLVMLNKCIKLLFSPAFFLVWETYMHHMFNIYQPTFRSFSLAICEANSYPPLGFLYFQTKKKTTDAPGREGHSPFWCPNVFLDIFGATIFGAIAGQITGILLVPIFLDSKNWFLPKSPRWSWCFKPCSHHPYLNITQSTSLQAKIGT